MSEWITFDPPIPFGPTFEAIPNDGKEHKIQQSLSFIGQNLNKPGTRIRTQDGPEYLIGDINTLGGVCDDCRGIYEFDLIAAYLPPEVKK